MAKLRKECGSDLIDYNMLMSCLGQYKAPHRKITTLLQSGTLIRIKKGLYLFGEDYRYEPIHKGLVANLIYGPSYVSLDYALAFYGMIPERVETVTSVTTKRHKLFKTPIGDFQYSYLNAARFTVGVDFQKITDELQFLIARPEKALADKVACYPEIRDPSILYEHLVDNLRIDEEMLRDMNVSELKRVQQAYNKPIVTLLLKVIEENFGG